MARLRPNVLAFVEVDASRLEAIVANCSALHPTPQRRTDRLFVSLLVNSSRRSAANILDVGFLGTFLRAAFVALFGSFFAKNLLLQIDA